MKENIKVIFSVIFMLIIFCIYPTITHADDIIESGSEEETVYEEESVHNHSYSQATCVSPATCGCGDTYGDCNMSNHIGETKLRGQKEATEKEEGYTGDSYCTECGSVITSGSTIPKIEKKECYGGTAYCKSYAICEDCGQEYGSYDYNNHKELVWKQNGQRHYKRCKDCGKEEFDFSGYHKYADTDDLTCDECGYERETVEIITESLGKAYVGREYTLQIKCNAESSEGAWLYDLGLPEGLRLYFDNKISGIPTTAGRYEVTLHLICGTNGNVETRHASKTYILEIEDPNHVHLFENSDCVREGECICGAKGEKDISYHTYGTKVVGAEAATYEKEGKTGNTICNGCGAILKESTVIPKKTTSTEEESTTQEQDPSATENQYTESETEMETEMETEIVSLEEETVSETYIIKETIVDEHVQNTGESSYQETLEHESTVTNPINTKLIWYLIAVGCILVIAVAGFEYLKKNGKV